MLPPMKEETEENPKFPQRGGVVSWSPPQPNWNPWLNCNIDDGPLARVSYHLVNGLEMNIIRAIRKIYYRYR